MRPRTIETSVNEAIYTIHWCSVSRTEERRFPNERETGFAFVWSLFGLVLQSRSLTNKLS